jgi:hypothetical protein
MAEFFEQLDPDHISFIEQQHIFFVGTAAKDGRVNVSPKGMDSLRILDPNHILWLNFTGSGNETAAHILDTNRMTLMFCSFDRQPLIMRLYGSAEVIYPRHEKFDTYNNAFGNRAGTRQFFELAIDTVQTSCGFAVPFMEHKGDRDTLQKLMDSRAADMPEAWKKNTTSIDGLPTAIFKDID